MNNLSIWRPSCMHVVKYSYAAPMKYKVQIQYKNRVMIHWVVSVVAHIGLYDLSALEVVECFCIHSGWTV